MSVIDVDELMRHLKKERDELSKTLEDRGIISKQSPYWMYTAGKRDALADLIGLLNKTEPKQEVLEPVIGFNSAPSPGTDFIEEYEDDE